MKDTLAEVAVVVDSNAECNRAITSSTMTDPGEIRTLNGEAITEMMATARITETITETIAKTGEEINHSNTAIRTNPGHGEAEVQPEDKEADPPEEEHTWPLRTINTTIQ